jgi:hypothetical protein
MKDLHPGHIFVFIGALLIILVLYNAVAKAHDWYEPQCCSGSDCKPVHDDDVAERPDGVHVRGWGVLSRTDPRIRTSRDDASHICETPGGILTSSRKLYCVYLKPSGT